MDEIIYGEVKILYNRDYIEPDELIRRFEKRAANEQFLLNAVHLGKCETVTDMLRLGVSVEARYVQILYNRVDFMTPLQIAASKGHADIIQILIDHGANVHAKNMSGTALHIAARNGHCDCLKMLLKAGADDFASIKMKTMAFDSLGASALNIAITNNHIDCVQELLEYGLDTNALDENGQSFRDVVALHAMCECVHTNIPFATHSEAASKTDTFETPFSSVKLFKDIKFCARKLRFIGSFRNDIESNGISPLRVLPNTGFEGVDLEIFKLFILESYCIDHHVPRGLTTLRHLGLEYYNSKIAAILITCLAEIIFKEGDVIFNISPIEYLLNTSERFGALKYVVNCILWVPRLSSLPVLPVANDLRKQKFYYENVENLVLPPNVTFLLLRDETCVYIEIHDREKELAELQLMWSDIVSGVPRYGRYPLQQPLLSIISERISDEIDQLKLIIGNDSDVRNVNYLQKDYYSELLKLKKYLWYEMNAFSPPTLQQCCRYSLLKYMGPLNVKNIRKLPLPNKLKSYLLFQ